jgi:hypothetical protein
MLIPESGDSNVMYSHTTAPANSPVDFAKRAAFETAKTTVIIRNEIRSSARNAVSAPPGPGVVVT